MDRVSQPRNIGHLGPSSRVPTMAFSAPSGLSRAAPPRAPSARPRAPSLDPPEFLLPPSPPVFSSVPQPMAVKKGDKSYRLAYISSSCPDVANFMPAFGPVAEHAHTQLPEVPEKSLYSFSDRLSVGANPIALGSSPTIFSVLQTPGSAPNQGSSLGRSLGGGHGVHEQVTHTAFSGHIPIRIQQTNQQDDIDDFTPRGSYSVQDQDEDDDLMFGPLSLGKEPDFLLGDGALDQANDQLGFLRL